jgi:hypothetical protein
MQFPPALSNHASLRRDDGGSRVPRQPHPIVPKPYTQMRGEDILPIAGRFELRSWVSYCSFIGDIPYQASSAESADILLPPDSTGRE